MSCFFEYGGRSEISKVDYRGARGCPGLRQRLRIAVTGQGRRCPPQVYVAVMAAQAAEVPGGDRCVWPAGDAAAGEGSALLEPGVLRFGGIEVLQRFVGLALLVGDEPQVILGGGLEVCVSGELAEVGLGLGVVAQAQVAQGDVEVHGRCRQACVQRGLEVTQGVFGLAFTVGLHAGGVVVGGGAEAVLPPNSTSVSRVMRKKTSRHVELPAGWGSC